MFPETTLFTSLGMHMPHFFSGSFPFVSCSIYFLLITKYWIVRWPESRILGSCMWAGPPAQSSLLASTPAFFMIFVLEWNGWMNEQTEMFPPVGWMSRYAKLPVCCKHSCAACRGVMRGGLTQSTAELEPESSVWILPLCVVYLRTT